MPVPNENYSVSTTVLKGAGDSAVVATGGTAGATIGWLLLSSLRARGVLPWDAGMDSAAVGLIATVIGGLLAFLARVWRNYTKNRWMAVFLCVGLSTLLQGCMTTRMADGTVVQQVDTRGLLEAYRLYLEHDARRADPSPSVDISVDGESLAVPVDSVRKELRLRGVDF